jgi:hypothetical protein
MQFVKSEEKVHLAHACRIILALLRTADLSVSATVNVQVTRLASIKSVATLAQEYAEEMHFAELSAMHLSATANKATKEIRSASVLFLRFLSHARLLNLVSHHLVEQMPYARSKITLVLAFAYQNTTATLTKDVDLSVWSILIAHQTEHA